MSFEKFASLTPLSLGIDPHIHSMPAFMKKKLDEQGPHRFLVDFGSVFLELALAEKVSSLKLQMSFFESQGSEGFKAIKTLTSLAKEKGLCLILDGKRGDIASTMAAYGSSAFEDMGADAITVMPYMGTDSFKALLPWLKRGKCVYSVCLPSNPSADLYEQNEVAKAFALGLATSIAQFFEQEKVLDSLGFVVGANRLETWLSQTSLARERPLLMPGIGAQGAKLSEASTLFLKSRTCDLIPVSRGISGFGEGYLDPDLDRISNWTDYQIGMVAKIRAFKKSINT
ncbi:MAG: orotidine-5'-phosphate decarboxylase [Pseudomonadota bacterium]